MPPPNLIIREARPDDAATLNAFVARIVDELDNNLPLDAGQWTKTDEEEREILAKAAADPDRAFLVAELDGHIVCCANIQRQPRPSARHVCSLGISVDARHRRQGIGRAMMHALIAWARERQIRRMELKVFARNTAAIRLYEQLGFVVEGRHRMAFRKQESWVDDLTMALILEAEPR